jgi:tRNA A37 threonylcarbamoyladenosine biosynthesis protein TsaE
VDLDRLEPKEVDDLGLDELGERAVVAIEWAERLPQVPRGRACRVTLRHAGDNTREIAIDIPEA